MIHQLTRHDTRIFVGKQVHILFRPQIMYVCVPDARFWCWYDDEFYVVLTS